MWVPSFSCMTVIGQGPHAFQCLRHHSQACQASCLLLVPAAHLSLGIACSTPGDPSLCAAPHPVPCPGRALAVPPSCVLLSGLAVPRTIQH